MEVTNPSSIADVVRKDDDDKEAGDPDKGVQSQKSPDSEEMVLADKLVNIDLAKKSGLDGPPGVSADSKGLSHEMNVSGD